MLPSDIARIVTIKDANFTGNLMNAGVAALIVYDYLLTVRRESLLFWKRRVNAASILFFANRYFALLYYVGLAYYRCLSLPYPVSISVACLGPSHPHRWLQDCQTQYYIDNGMRYLQYLPWAGTLFIRGGQIVADAVVIGVTWKATYHARSEGSMSFLTRVMFRNGTTYFIILLGLNVLHTVSIFLPDSFLHVPYTNTAYVTKFSEPITAILISHFILDLHETNRAMSRQDAYALSGIQIMGTDIGQLTSESSVSERVEEWAVSPSPWRDIQSV
ncbi:hypothetical protein GSI_15496 [Ganoderma sinense ZZ0214-1]|uniref:DUF6533 domain-containing protein n=1 Tax=Ganoderma sinense ZZ0214-1 TaxID=1077348 RepID=A0A2G8RMS5_9APHY|nr:hypothetical protein GSI_15496 [Ganoderma sinense ZZ0214-1]